MKKNRNSFFNETTDYMSYNNSVASQNMMPMQAANNPYPPAVNAQSSFQMNGMNPMPNNMMQPAMPNVMPNNMQTMQEDLESRLAKMERQIARLDHRLTKLETNTTLSTNDYESNINNMYMV